MAGWNAAFFGLDDIGKGLSRPQPLQAAGLDDTGLSWNSSLQNPAIMRLARHFFIGLSLFTKTSKPAALPRLWPR